MSSSLKQTLLSSNSYLSSSPPISSHPHLQTISHKLSSTSLSFPPNSRWTKQEFASECDINTIMSQYQSTGVMPNINERAPQYLDCTELGNDFQYMQNQVLEAQELFAELPSKLRNRFSNDPASFLNWVSDPSNLPEMAELGLTNPPSSISTPEAL